MKNSLSLLRRGVATVAFSTMVLSSAAFGQGKGEVSSLSFDKLQSPEVNSGESKSWKPLDWLEIEAEVTIPAQNREQKAYGFIDKIEVEWYLAIQEKLTKKTVLITKRVTHINVPVDDAFFVSAYLSPTTVKRLTGSDTASSNMVAAAGVVVRSNGEPVAQKAEKEKEGWWNAGSLSRTEKYPLLNKDETPFRMLWWDRYAEIEKER
jgi:hypothetical protein